MELNYVEGNEEFSFNNWHVVKAIRDREPYHIRFKPD